MIGLCTVIVVLCADRFAGADPAPHPNILFILPDQWRAFATGYAGDPNVKTPNLDRLAAQSANFTNAVSTCPVCSPFRASLLTGQRATTHGIFLNDAHLADNAVTLGKILDSAGYFTAWIGKWHLNGRGRLSFIPPENRQGFEYWKVCECTHMYNHSIYFGDTPEQLVWPGYDAFAQTDDAKQYIRDHAKSGKPFALFLAWGPPHDPYGTAPAEFRQMYHPGDIKLRSNVPNEYAASSKRNLASYYAHCSALDRCVGELWRTLRDAGIEKNTILVFTSDHGDMLGSHGMEKKQKPWDEAVRVPMLWHYPAALGEGGKKLDAVIASEDLMPTLLGLSGVKAPPSAEGIDFAPYLRGGENPKPDNAALIECVAPFGEWNRTNGGREFRGIRTGRYTYVRDLAGPWLLYDNDIDPYQNENLADKPAAAEVRARLDGVLSKHLKAAGDGFLPAGKYLEKWGYADKVDKTGTLPTRP
ncbi:MAG TPA: sulfatase [Tepidisphaeraceae bacterium]|nr:sulfatase [Tepidisphaeraceae bacterium]